jgi:hypothetical protein
VLERLLRASAASPSRKVFVSCLVQEQVAWWPRRMPVAFQIFKAYVVVAGPLATRHCHSSRAPRSREVGCRSTL